MQGVGEAGGYTLREWLQSVEGVPLVPPLQALRVGVSLGLKSRN